ncbi:Ribonuclease D [Methylophaga thiooxydans]|uniref:Ribonuclease D n=1 Tax=Methylophaga thiooxydans TaxID=392484 RepID=A0A0A0BDQ8_9GAMM|nr:ribonuclease D [Methylophaga thiooxydans]KGM06673.1 Ribonuclease D [Methylophaga thiooxydans]
MTIQFIDSSAGLKDLCEQLAESTWLAIDTEFHREKTYYPQLCLIQVANDDVIACVDPLKIDDLSPLMDVFYRTDMTLVFHAARQDLELLFLLRDALPQQVFDTQLAATVLGYGDQIGYGNLVKQCLNVDLDKAHARTDWRQRPLSPEQIDYAADDVRYLRELYHQLEAKLVDTGRINWLKEDFATLSATETYQSNPESSWLRIKGAGRLKSSQLAVLQQLGVWREQRAIKQNLPRRWIIKDDVMLDLARFSPSSLDAMNKIRGLESRDIDRHGQAILKAIEAGKAVPQEQWPVMKRPQPLSNQQDALVDALMGLLRKLCDEQTITPVAVATRKDIEALVRDQDSPIKHGWRHEIVGQKLEQFLAGELKLSASQQQLEIQ